MQHFKGDETELKFEGSASTVLDELSLQKDLFFSGAYSAAPLGDVLYTAGRTPLSNAIVKSIFRTSFNEIFESFKVAGSFESYISVFKKIFGVTADIQFTIPGPGKLIIDIIATEIVLDNLAPRYIVENTYILDHLVTQDGVDKIMLQSIKGFQSQYELEQMLFEMVPAGIFTEINLTLGA